MLRLMPLVLISYLAVGHRSTEAASSSTDIYRDTLRVTAWVVTPAKGKGTGWVVDRARKLIVTNYHVVGDNESVDVVFPIRRDGRLVTERSYYISNLRELK